MKKLKKYYSSLRLHASTHWVCTILVCTYSCTTMYVYVPTYTSTPYILRLRLAGVFQRDANKHCPPLDNCCYGGLVAVVVIAIRLFTIHHLVEVLFSFTYV